MSAAAHQSAIHWLTAQQPEPLMQAQVEALVAQHERACAKEAEEEAASNPPCPPCHYGWSCRQGRCGLRGPKNGG